MNNYDVTVIGGGPAGLAAAIKASEAGARVLLIEREGRLGGVLKQCIHDGFGVIRFGEKLSGCEYAERFIHEIAKTDVEISLSTFASKIDNTGAGFLLHLSNKDGFSTVTSRTLVLATGCRERTARQVFIQGTRPAGIITAGAAQYFINVMGEMPGKRCVILGSGDIGLIMARRLTLGGAEVLGVYEAKPEPSGLMRNIYQCLVDFDIPLHLSHTVVRAHGRGRLTGVTVAAVDEHMQPISGTEEYIPCDTLVLSVGLIPENELAETLGVSLAKATKGAVCDQNYMTSVPGIFACGNALHVNDLVDYVSESGEKAGEKAAAYALHAAKPADQLQQPSKESACVLIEPDGGFLYSVPQKLELGSLAEDGKVQFFFRSKLTRGGTTVRMYLDDKEIFTKKYQSLRPPEMEKFEYDFSGGLPAEGQKIRLVMEEAEGNDK